ncbi:FAD-binding oxidoreductase [Dactylosporangium sp. NPDC051484]|uniref:FAD-binding oxidoreductase n=1 Tax=Dactylosporangium sp. NPDC051484 TaxID=3154942 RepID=UPI003450341B
MLNTDEPRSDDLTWLRSQVRGPVYTPGDPELPAEIPTFNTAVAHHPTVVVGATGAEDVAAAVRWAAAHRLPVAVQATGHGVVLPVDDAMLITTHRMRQITVDPQQQTAHIEAGVRWREVIEAAAGYGLAPLSGSSSSVGAVGYTLGGGIGLLGREYGFAADHVLSVDLVTADGRLRHVTAETDPELFWALRGGKGNFGIATAMQVRLFPVAALYAGGLFFAASSAADVLHAYRGWAPTLPENASSSVALMRMPPVEQLPEPLRGKFVMHLRFSYHGPAAEGEDLLAPMRSAGAVVLEHVGVLPYEATDVVHQDPTDPMPVWERGGLLHSFEADTVDALLKVAGPELDVPLIMVDIRLLGGALSRPASPPNAVSGREGAYSVYVIAPSPPPLKEIVPVVGGAVLDALEPWLTGTSLLNFLGAAATPQQVAAAWTPDVYTRLRAVKNSVDPGNLFRFGHAIGI